MTAEPSHASEETRVEANRRSWEARAQAHLQYPSLGYDVAGLRAGRCSLRPIERELAGEVRGLRLLHLMCHLGFDSISWARRGAIVTAVDFSAEALTAAQALAVACGTEVRWVQADVRRLPEDLAGPFDRILMTYGTLCWLPDLAPVVRGVAARLAPGGRFILADGHPLRDALPDDPLREGFVLRGSCLYRTTPFHHVATSTYTGAPIPAADEYQWTHDVGRIVQTVCDAGLQVRALRELPWCHWACFPGMHLAADGTWWLPPDAPEIPLLLALRADRPSA